MASLTAIIRRAFYGDRSPASGSEALRNIGQLQFTGRLADPIPFQDPPPDVVELDQRELPWELREEE
jgi:hypothetical protein